jgi:hypothetical protein
MCLIDQGKYRWLIAPLGPLAFVCLIVVLIHDFLPPFHSVLPIPSQDGGMEYLRAHSNSTAALF